jgi:hypothetical protein
MTLWDGIYGVYRDHSWIFWSGFPVIVLGVAWLIGARGLRAAGRNVLPLDPPRRRHTDRVVSETRSRGRSSTRSEGTMTSRRVQ